MEREIIKMYAIIDIESTGGDYDEEGITEIAIYQYDGYKITDQFCSLINPKKPIQPFVKKLINKTTFFTILDKNNKSTDISFIKIGWLI